MLLHIRHIFLAHPTWRLLLGLILRVVTLSLPALVDLRDVLLLALDEDLLKISHALIDHALFVLVLALWFTSLLEGAITWTPTPTTWQRVRHEAGGALTLLSLCQVRERRGLGRLHPATIKRYTPS